MAGDQLRRDRPHMVIVTFFSFRLGVFSTPKTEKKRVWPCETNACQCPPITFVRVCVLALDVVNISTSSFKFVYQSANFCGVVNMHYLEIWHIQTVSYIYM